MGPRVTEGDISFQKRAVQLRFDLWFSPNKGPCAQIVYTLALK